MASTIVGKAPSKQCFAGALSSQYGYREAQEEDEAFQDLAPDVAPFTIGATFRIPAIEDLEEDATLEVTPHAVGYQRRFPSVDEQRAYVNDNEDADVLFEEEGTVEAADDSREARVDGDSDENVTLLQVYERVPFEFDSIELSVDDLEQLLEVDGSEPQPLNVSQGLQEAAEFDNRFREVGENERSTEAEQVPVERLESATEFRDYLGQTYTGQVLEPIWEARMELEAQDEVTQDGESYLRLTGRLVNSHGENFEEAIDPEYEDWRATLFDVEVAATVENTDLEVFDSEEIEDKYQYDGTIHGIGENCTVEPIYPAEDSGNVDQTPRLDAVSAEESEENNDTDDTGDLGPSAVGVRTETVPIYEQARYLSRTAEDLGPQPSVLAGDRGEGALFDQLQDLAGSLERAAEQYESVKEVVTAGKSAHAQNRFDEETVDAIRDEHERFTTGMRCLREDDRALEAFKLANRTFAESGIPSWYPFQIVFLVSTLPDMLKQVEDSGGSIDASLDDADSRLDIADVLYFPTGGGKTEAYLSLVVFTAFHDRLRGKDFGTTAWAKFPLRFLSVQQLRRIADVLAEAELVRRAHDDAGEGRPFSVGYLVGKQNTPNALREDGNNYARDAQREDDFRSDVQYVEECPFCETESVEVDGDRVRGRVVHKCTNERCDWVGEYEDEHDVYDSGEAPLPIYVTDREVYRYAPTFVISTIDKISIIGMQRRMRTLFGQVKGECQLHGFAGEDRCVADTGALVSSGECDEEHWLEQDTVEPPSLLIQDELHLLREEFGAFDSHYESFIQAYTDRIVDEGDWTTKVVAATATIEGAERQVRALYRRDPNKFPSRGPRLRQSLYAYEHPRRVQRRMVGVVPRSISRTYALEKVHEEYARTVQEFADSPELLENAVRRVAHSSSAGDSHDQPNDGEATSVVLPRTKRAVGTDPFSLTAADLSQDEEERRRELSQVLVDYQTQVSYHYSKDNTDLMMRTIRTMINEHLRESGGEFDYEELEAELLTGGTSLGTVTDVIERLDNVEDSEVDPLDVIVATSMISHGVDIDALNFIGFFGLPRDTAEYIQSYSRVGREWTGTVLMLHDPTRTRDRSYYRRFQHHQAYQDLLVEATPLERWAEFAIQCTLPGLFCAALVQYYDFEIGDQYDDRVYMFNGLTAATEDGEIAYQDLLEFVEEAYDVANPDPSLDPSSAIELYRSQLENIFQDAWDASRADSNRVPDAVANDRSNDENNFVPIGVLGRDEDVRTPMRNLRDIDEQLTVSLGDDTNRIINSYRD